MNPNHIKVTFDEHMLKMIVLKRKLEKNPNYEEEVKLKIQKQQKPDSWYMAQTTDLKTLDSTKLKKDIE